MSKYIIAKELIFSFFFYTLYVGFGYECFVLSLYFDGGVGFAAKVVIGFLGLFIKRDRKGLMFRQLAGVVEYKAYVVLTKFLKNFLETSLLNFQDHFFFNLASKRIYQGHLCKSSSDYFFLKICLYQLTSLHAVHNWHVYVQYDRLIKVSWVTLDCFKGFLAIFCSLYYIKVRTQLYLKAFKQKIVVVS